MRPTTTVVYFAVDSLIPALGKGLAGFEEFTAALDHQGIPAVWLTTRSRLQFDEPRRRMGHRHPFIAEAGCGVYLPEDYFHLRPETSKSRSSKGATLRLGRFTCIPIAQPLPSASEALETLSQDTGVLVVTLRSLSPRELMQNTGLPQREAELARQRDFDEVFFFAGASDAEIAKFLAEGRARKLDFRQEDVLWSVAAGASVPRCILELTKLYDRALHHHAQSVAIATKELAPALFPNCDRTIFLSRHESEEPPHAAPEVPRMRHISLRSPDVWEKMLYAIHP